MTSICQNSQMSPFEFHLERKNKKEFIIKSIFVKNSIELRRISTMSFESKSPVPPSTTDEPLTTQSSSSDWETTDSTDSDEELPVDLTFDWLDEQMRAGVDLRPMLAKIIPGLPSDVSQSTIYEILMDLFLPIRRRKVLDEYKSLDDAVELIRKSKNILVLTGAGISVSCGIPDFRSRNGIYARLHVEFPELPNPQSMFDIQYFTDDPRPFFRFAKEIWPGQYEPSLSHFFIAELERRGQLLRNYTQNIDSLEHLCPITRLIQCHGSFSTATCRQCHHQVKSDEIKEEILQQKIPHCSKCPTDCAEAILKPDIVFFGEALPDDFHNTISTDKDQCDLLIVMGSSLKVKPVSLVSELLPGKVPQILINRERLLHKTFDIELLGNCDVIVNELCVRLAQSESSFGQIKHLTNDRKLNEILYENIRSSVSSSQPKKKLKVSLSTDDQEEKEEKTSKQQSSTTLTEVDFDSSYVHHRPRRYIFTGAETNFSSDDSSSSSDDENDDDKLLRKDKTEE